jgi:cell division protein FtsB
VAVSTGSKNTSRHVRLNMTVIEALNQKLADARAEVAKIETEIANIPVEVHNLESDTWDKIKAFFGIA